MNFGIFSRPGGKGHHDDVIPVHFGKGASDEAKKDALHTFSHQQCIACEKVQKTSHPIIWAWIQPCLIERLKTLTKYLYQNEDDSCWQWTGRV